MRKLDLHGLPYEEAERRVIRFVEDNWDSDREVEIITGNSNKMKDVVKKVLTEYKLSYRIGDMAKVNTGFIKVYL